MLIHRRYNKSVSINNYLLNAEIKNTDIYAKKFTDYTSQEQSNNKSTFMKYLLDR